MSLLPMLSLGLVLGVVHAADADHVVAVSTLVGDRRGVRSAALIGTFWGIGHTLTVGIVGGALLAFRWVVPPSLGLTLELAVAVMLVALGGVALRSRHTHVSAVRPLRSLGIGVVHGLAGSAAVALAVLTQVPETGLGLLYLGCFGLGTIAGMMAITTLVALPFAAFGERLTGLEHWLRTAMGAASVALGIALAMKIGFVDGLFLGTPSWSPH